MRILAVPALFILTSLVALAADYPPSFEGAREEVYKTIGELELNLWVFDPPDLRPTDERPAIVFFFGGGWKQGDPGQFEPHCRYLASQGIVAMTADYRVRTRHETLADRCVADAKSAIRWVRQNAKRLGVDPTRVVAAGGSAGGHLAACTGVVPGLDEPDEDLTVSSVPNALALFNPCVLLESFQDVTLSDEKLADIATRTGVEPKQISPIHHVRSDLPPTIIFHGEADVTVPFATVKKFTEVAVRDGNRCELVAYPGETHGFFNAGRHGDPGESYLSTVYRLHQFLNSLGYVENEPAISLPRSANVHMRSHFENSRRALEKRKNATVAFLGGSITKMNGYRVLVEQSLQRRFPETEFRFINAGISSTCSTTGSMRLQRDVLSADPDLLFVEFAVNDDQDAAHEKRECMRGMEGILRQARRHNRGLDIVVTHFVNPPMLEKLDRGETPVSSSAHESVAKHYGVSTIDLARELSDRIAAGETTWEEYGGTHPKKPGNQMAADMIDDLLDAVWAQKADWSVEPSPHALPKPIDPNSYAGGKFVSVREAQLGKGWSIERPDWSRIGGSVRERFLDQLLLCSAEVGSELTLSFKGTGVGLYVLAGPDAGTIEFSIDDEPFRKVDLYHRFSKSLHYPRTVMLAADLERGAHKLKLRVAKEKYHESRGNAVRLLQFAVN